jgi:hypothetical protein
LVVREATLLVVMPAVLVPDIIGWPISVPVLYIVDPVIGGNPHAGIVPPVVWDACAGVIDHVAIVEERLVAILQRRPIYRTAQRARCRNHTAGRCKR